MFYNLIHDTDITSIIYGYIDNITEPLCIIGGNCTIQGFNNKGDEIFWTVTGENVSCFLIRDIITHKELLCASEDYYIRIYHHEEVINEIKEVDICIKLACSSGLNKNNNSSSSSTQNLFSYGLKNNQIGVYKTNQDNKNYEKLWSYQATSSIIDLIHYDINKDNLDELIIGYDNGLIEIRNLINGQLIISYMLSSSIAKIFIGNFNDVKETQLMVLTIKGQLKGFKAIKVNKNINLLHQQQLLLNKNFKKKFNLLKQI